MSGSEGGNRSEAQQRVNIVVFDIINKIDIIELRRAGAFVERMWLSKKKTSASELASISLF